ncbi:hypothetical protein [Falsiroseomonas sp. E2-1-a4]|uniref:hypothetical protein n=1 Tax=Falsiroseomonas sp. E2-1-a4 TaxID=3239299 RepID=UPI003F37EA3A
MASIDIPLPEALTKFMEVPKCIDLSLPKPNLPQLRLPTGGTIKGIADITKGIPSDCSMNASLMRQIAPIMASMECLLKLLKFVGVLIDTFKELSSGNVTAIPGGLAKIAEAGKEVLPCIGMAIGLTIPPFIKDLILLIVKMLKCALQALKSVIKVLDGLELEISTAAQNGNDLLVAQLECAKENAMNAADGALQAIDPIATVLQLAAPFFELVPGAPAIELPSLASDGSIDGLKTLVETLEEVVLVLEGIAEALPV